MLEEEEEDGDELCDEPDVPGFITMDEPIDWLVLNGVLTEPIPVTVTTEDPKFERTKYAFRAALAYPTVLPIAPIMPEGTPEAAIAFPRSIFNPEVNVAPPIPTFAPSVPETIPPAP